MSLLPIFLAAAVASAPPARPNVVLILLDDAGYGDFGFTGHPTIRTPNLDKLAHESVAATQFAVSTPACTASRYSILTGRQPLRSGFGTWVLNPDSKPHLKLSERTMAETFQDEGYRTAMIGKWHLGYPNKANGFTADSLPLRHGFDGYFGLPYSHDMIGKSWGPLQLLEAGSMMSEAAKHASTAPLFRHDPLARPSATWLLTGVRSLHSGADGGMELIPGYRILQTDPGPEFLTRSYTDAAIKFLGKGKEPKFVCLWHSLPHVPLGIHPSRKAKSKRGLYGDVIEELDAEIGRLLKSINRRNTLVLFTSDNGPWILKKLEAGSSGLFKDGKGSTWEGGVRVPMLFSWPGKLKPGVTHEPISAVDLAATVTSLALGKPLAGTDGRDLTPLLQGRSMPEAPIFESFSDTYLHAVRKGRWKLVLRTSSQIGMKYFDDPLPLLFDLDQDPSETQNVAKEHLDVVNALLEIAKNSGLMKP